MSKPIYRYTQGLLDALDGVELLNLRPLDLAFYDPAESGPMYTCEPRGFDGVLHLRADEIVDLPLLIDGDGEADTYYTGDLTAGQALASENRYVFTDELTGSHYSVLLCDSLNRDDLAEWGSGQSVEEAWRYALGAMFGPVDDEYDEALLRSALARQVCDTCAAAGRTPNLNRHDSQNCWQEESS